ncbi:LysM peptidoglycan-binding domain-containing protein [Nocardioides sp. STR2]|uniref:LysM peptidoglycan-binding domain-containing protein n=1 Tax=Nocardioides pini TaxID=2975053 RepID=A0ABT4CAG8_9ACTN|nr:LysM peptidoglycan-binding domain-containing protein [Nocardioides pini]MCY4725945.1 LysM peptidoglycan-binding domain-containing protein [Nocardioides pini]
MALEHALVEILDADAIDGERGLPRYLPVLFNPTEYTLTKGAQIAEIAIPGLDSPVLQFVRGQTQTLKLELFFDTTETGMDEGAADVRTLTNPFFELVRLQPKTHAPPRIRVTWGEGLSFKAIVESVDQKFTLFTPAGIPLRATLSVALREYRTLEEQLAELNLQSADHTRTRVVVEGDTFASIARDEYGDPTAWRLLADANRDVDDPTAPPVGRRLVVPRVEDRATERPTERVAR